MLMCKAKFIKIIKLRSFWKIDKRKGNYTLPSGNKLSTYIKQLVISQMEVDNLYMLESGDFEYTTGYVLNNVQIERIDKLVNELIEGV